MSTAAWIYVAVIVGGPAIGALVLWLKNANDRINRSGGVR